MSSESREIDTNKEIAARETIQEETRKCAREDIYNG